MKLHHIAVQTSDLPRSLHFYRSIFGGRVVKETHRFRKRLLVFIEIGDALLELYSVRKGERLSEWREDFPGPVHLAFEVNNLKDFLNVALGKGAQFHKDHPEPFVPVEGEGEIAYLCGPDNEEIEVREGRISS